MCGSCVLDAHVFIAMVTTAVFVHVPFACCLLSRHGEHVVSMMLRTPATSVYMLYQPNELDRCCSVHLVMSAQLLIHPAQRLLHPHPVRCNAG
ncbi:hypothetical protein BD311DRAFT_758025 [Dichomitus squalens]|uniref:Uncharacterized protein n=1 Tax=Dichomitus squalens TaxID=114155 RepID=A0A4Q9MN96_9APHY|nr:hypothetical protein BD311DRAFT_758025 [Dichomitus squalens]